MNNQKGFTLIELVVVIVILGILAATAAPRFIDLQDDAETATLQAVKAAMESANTLVYSKSLIAGVQNTDSTNVQVNNAALAVEYGYPDAAQATWLALLDLDMTDDTSTSEFTFHVGTNTFTVYAQGREPDSSQAVTDACSVTFTKASEASNVITAASIGDVVAC